MIYDNKILRISVIVMAILFLHGCTEQPKDKVFRRAADYLQKGMNDEAIVELDEAIRIDPSYSAAYNNRGVAYLNKDDDSRAIADFDKAIEIDPHYGKAFANRAIAHFHRQEYNESRNDAQKAQELGHSVKPELQDALKVLGNTCEIKTEHYGLKLLMTKAEVYRIIGRENFGEFKTDIPEVSEIRTERKMFSVEYDLDAYTRGAWYDKESDWIKTVNQNVQGKDVNKICCYFFGDIFYKIAIEYDAFYSGQISWDVFVAPARKAYKIIQEIPNNIIIFDDGETKLTITSIYVVEYGYSYYRVEYESNRISKNVEAIHHTHYPAPQF